MHTKPSQNAHANANASASESKIGIESEVSWESPVEPIHIFIYIDRNKNGGSIFIIYFKDKVCFSGLSRPEFFLNIY